MQAKDFDYVIVEGQGSILHPGSTATLPLMRGSCPNRLIMCHRAGMERTRTNTKVPPLREFIQLNEALAACCGSLTAAKTLGVALNTADLAAERAADEVSAPGRRNRPALSPTSFDSALANWVKHCLTVDCQRTMRR